MLKTRDTEIQKKRRLLNAHQWKGSNMVHWTSTEAEGSREYWCKAFTLCILRSALWLKDWLPPAILLQAAWHRSLYHIPCLKSAAGCYTPHPGPCPPLPSYGMMIRLRAASKSERLDSQLVIFRFPCQRSTAKAILGCLAINLPRQRKHLFPSPLRYSISISWSTVLSKTRLEDFI